jgi:hypothetical protein
VSFLRAQLVGLFRLLRLPVLYVTLAVNPPMINTAAATVTIGRSVAATVLREHLAAHSGEEVEADSATPVSPRSYSDERLQPKANADTASVFARQRRTSRSARG